MVQNNNPTGPESLCRPPPTSRTLFLLGVLLVLATLLPYVNSFQAPFIFDDLGWILDNPRVRDLSRDWRRLGSTNRPVIAVTLAINYAVGHLNVRGYHLFNFVVHAVAGLALFGIVRRTITLHSLRSGRDLPAVSLAFTVALVWLVHPLQTQSVTYIIQRCESMMGMFFLLCLYCVLRGAQAARGWPWYAAAVVACVLGLGCKEVMATAPAVILLYDRAFLSSSWGEVARRRGWLYAVLFGVVLGTVFLLRSIIFGQGSNSAGFGYREITPLEYLATQPGVILHYLRLSAWPNPLCLDYLWQPATRPSEIYPQAAAVIVLLASSAVVFFFRPWLGFLGLSFFIVLAPTSSFLPIKDLAVEHRMYLPLAAVVMLAVLLWYGVTERLVRDPTARRVARVGPASMAVLVLVGLTMQRNLDYSEPSRMWTKLIEVAPHNPRGYFSLGATYTARGDIERAKRCFEQTIVVAPRHVRAHGNLGMLLIRQGDLERGERYLRQALEFDPRYTTGLVNMGNLMARREKWHEAEAYYRRALEIEPSQAQTLQSLAAVLLRTDRGPEAVEILREAVRWNPHAVEVRVQLAWVLATCPNAHVRDGREAFRLAEEAKKQTGDGHLPVMDALAAAYAELGRFDEAAHAAERCVQLARVMRLEERIAELEYRLALYRDRQPYRDTGAAVSRTDAPSEPESLPQTGRRDRGLRRR
jgi:Flp pilus assembly protein TadD